MVYLKIDANYVVVWLHYWESENLKLIGSWEGGVVDSKKINGWGKGTEIY